MSFLLRLFGFVVLLPSLAHAATLGIPGNGAKLSGVSVISGWKCEAEGDLTIVFNDDGKHIPLLYGTERTDVRANGRCLDNDHDNVGFVAIWNWGNLGDGEHTAVAYDDGVPFAESTFTVTTPGSRFLIGASKRITVDDFPMPGDSMVLEWNQGTQHFEIVDFMESGPIDMESGPIDLGACMEGLTVGLGEMCSSSINLAGEEIGFIFSVDANGQGCVEPEIDITLPCFNTGQEFENLLSTFGVSGASITKNTDGSWTIDSFPTDL